MNSDGQHLILYISWGSFFVLLTWFFIKSRINHSFREKTIRLLKNQKAQIATLESNLDSLKKEKEALRVEKINREKHIEDQNKKFSKIRYFISPGLTDLTTQLASADHGGSSTLIQQTDQYGQILSLWHQAFFQEPKPSRGAIELTEYIHDLCEDLTHHFSSAHLNFLHHISEPIEVNAHRDMIEYIFFHIGRIMGERSVSGNTIYIDTERTGKKCLITFEDAGPGIDDGALKSLLIKINNQETFGSETHPETIPLMFIRDFIEWHEGKLWLSSIQEIGIKFTFSLPLIT